MNPINRRNVCHVQSSKVKRSSHRKTRSKKPSRRTMTGGISFTHASNTNKPYLQFQIISNNHQELCLFFKNNSHFIIEPDITLLRQVVTDPYEVNSTFLKLKFYTMVCIDLLLIKTNKTPLPENVRAAILRDINVSLEENKSMKIDRIRFLKREFCTIWLMHTVQHPNRIRYLAGFITFLRTDIAQLNEYITKLHSFIKSLCSLPLTSDSGVTAYPTIQFHASFDNLIGFLCLSTIPVSQRDEEGFKQFWNTRQVFMFDMVSSLRHKHLLDMFNIYVALEPIDMPSIPPNPPSQFTCTRPEGRYSSETSPVSNPKSAFEPTSSRTDSFNKTRNPPVTSVSFITRGFSNIMSKAKQYRRDNHSILKFDNETLCLDNKNISELNDTIINDVVRHRDLFGGNVVKDCPNFDKLIFNVMVCMSLLLNKQNTRPLPCEFIWVILKDLPNSEYVIFTKPSASFAYYFCKIWLCNVCKSAICDEAYTNRHRLHGVNDIETLKTSFSSKIQAYIGCINGLATAHNSNAKTLLSVKFIKKLFSLPLESDGTEKKVSIITDNGNNGHESRVTNAYTTSDLGKKDIFQNFTYCCLLLSLSAIPIHKPISRTFNQYKSYTSDYGEFKTMCANFFITNEQSESFYKMYVCNEK